MRRVSNQPQTRPPSTNLKDQNQYSIPTRTVYFENQGLNLLCGLHSVNNFLGFLKYTVDDMNEICYELAQGKQFLNPHKHWFFNGDYDVNVLMLALQRQRFEVKWHDRRNKLSKQDLTKIEGFLVNVQVVGSLLGSCGCLCCISGRHWLSVKKLVSIETKVEGVKWAILDSSQNSYSLKGENQFLEYIHKIEAEHGQVLSISYNLQRHDTIVTENNAITSNSKQLKKD